MQIWNELNRMAFGSTGRSRLQSIQTHKLRLTLVVASETGLTSGR